MFIENDVIEYIKGFFWLEGDFKEVGLEETDDKKNVIVFGNEKNQYFGVCPIGKNVGKVVRVFKKDDNFALSHCSGVLQIRYILAADGTFASEAFVMSHSKYFEGKAFNFDSELIAIRLGGR